MCLFLLVILRVCENDDERKFKTNVLALFDVIFVLLGGESEFQIKIS